MRFHTYTNSGDASHDGRFGVSGFSYQYRVFQTGVEKARETHSSWQTTWSNCIFISCLPYLTKCPRRCRNADRSSIKTMHKEKSFLPQGQATSHQPPRPLPQTSFIQLIVIASSLCVFADVDTIKNSMQTRCRQPVEYRCQYLDH